MRVGVGFSDSPDSAVAGRQAVQSAFEKAGMAKPCDMVLLFCTARHDQQVLRDAVAAEAGNATQIYGGGAVGIITNDEYGYAGDQVGVACLWLEGVECNTIIEGGLLEGEEEVGMRLGKQLAALGIEADSPVMLFYDAIDRSGGDIRILMATWLLQGLEKGLGFLPDLMGAGMQGDHACSPTRQYIGESIGEHNAMAMTFSDDICIDSAIMHGCRPASAYYTVTKAQGPVILEINGEPAIPFIDRVLDSAISPDEYPFFLLFGLNHGERWGEYDENNYASRLCLGIDKETDGIVMFEPDMVPGTEFQIMFRSLDLEYMKPKIEALFDRLDGRKPLFGLYIDCAGRCAGYGGIDLEDAVVLQETIAGRVPLLGLYTGVEIASIGGRPRGLDWTGVFCLFSKRDGNAPTRKRREVAVWEQRSGGDGKEEAPIEAMRKLAEQNAAKVLKLDTELIAIRHELEQKRRGFGLLAELSVSLRQTADYEEMLHTVTQRINSALNMQKTVILRPDAGNRFVPTTLHGYSAEEKANLEGQHIEVDESMLGPENAVLVTAADEESRLAGMRSAFKLPYFISVPVIVKDEVVAILITGRMVEAMPFLSRLGRNDVETVQAVGALLSTVLVHQRLEAADRKAQLDGLTGLYNREAFAHDVNVHLKDMQNTRMHALILIDFDHFKQVNDTYGHLQGDEALKALAVTLRDNCRSTDIVARISGDEFAVFCSSITKVEQAVKTVDRLLEAWRAIEFSVGETKYKATLSIGIAAAPRDGMEYSELFQKADVALYQSKQEGRDRYTIYQG